jgi:hypothetical protein
MMTEASLEVPDVGGYENSKTLPLCARVGFVQFVYDDHTRTVTRRGNTCGPDWTSAPFDTPVLQVAADDTRLAVLCEDGTVTMFRAFTGDVVYTVVVECDEPTEIILLAINSCGVVGVVRVSTDRTSITWEAAEEDEEVDRHPALSVSHLRYVDAQVMRDQLYVLCRGERGTATKVVVYSIGKQLARIGTLLLPVDKAASATGLSVRAAPGLLAVQECDVFLTYREHKSVTWRIPLEFCEL